MEAQEQHKFVPSTSEGICTGKPCRKPDIENKKGIAPEVPVQELPKITFDFGVIGPSRFYITTDKSFYDGMKENPRFVPTFTPNDFKESLHILEDFQLYIFRVSQE
jgi:hypothetical protein